MLAAKFLVTINANPGEAEPLDFATKSRIIHRVEEIIEKALMVECDPTRDDLGLLRVRAVEFDSAA